MKRHAYLINLALLSFLSTNCDGGPGAETGLAQTNEPVDGLSLVANCSEATWLTVASEELSSLETSEGHFYNMNLNAIDGIDNNRVFAVGDGGVVLKRNNTGWYREPVPFKNDLGAVLTFEEMVFMGGANGLFAGFDGIDWIQIEHEGCGFVTGIWGESKEELYFVCRLGRIYHFDGVQSELVLGYDNTSFHGIAGSQESGVVVVGEQNGSPFAMRLINDRWQIIYDEIANGNDEFIAVWCGTEDLCWVTSWEGNIWRLDSDSWLLEQTVPKVPLSVWGRNSKELYVVANGGNGVVEFGFDGKDWSSLTSTSPTSIHAIWGDSDVGVFAVGREGFLGYKHCRGIE